MDTQKMAMAQDIMLCDMCETSPVQMHCNSCAVNLCKGCVSEHISADTEKDHHVVIFKKKNTKPIFPNCKTHTEQNCEMKCQSCEIPVCVKCLALGSHRTHPLKDLLEICNSRKDTIKQKTIVLEKSTYPKYEKLIAELEDQIKKLPQTFAKMTSDVLKQGEEWHREVDVMINQQKQEVEKMKTDNLATLNKLLDEMKNLLSTLRQAIKENNDILHSADVTKVLDSKYTSPEMWDPPPSIDMTPPTFTPLPVQGIQLHQMFGTLTAASMPTPSTFITPPIQGKQLHQMTAASRPTPLSFINLGTPTNQQKLPPSRQAITSDSPYNVMNCKRISQTQKNNYLWKNETADTTSCDCTGQDPLTASMLATAPPQEQKQMLGDCLFPLISQMYPDLAGKITGMLLEIDNSELLHMLKCHESLKAKVKEAVAVLQAHQAREYDSRKGSAVVVWQ